ncbi:helix-turn-helix domain-containing protein [Corynebacterium diphtheriae]
MKFYSVKEVAEMVGMSKDGIYTAIHRGDLVPAGRTSSGTRAHYKITEKISPPGYKKPPSRRKHHRKCLSLPLP